MPYHAAKFENKILKVDTEIISLHDFGPQSGLKLKINLSSRSSEILRCQKFTDQQTHRHNTQRQTNDSKPFDLIHLA